MYNLARVAPSRESLDNPSVELASISDIRVTQLAEVVVQKPKIRKRSCPTRVSYITQTATIKFLRDLLAGSERSLGAQDIEILALSKSYKEKTQFYLNTQGCLLLIGAAFLSGVASGAGYYYGVDPTSIDLVRVSVIMGTAAAVAAIASNMLGFYITGTLPNNASEAENREQNMWDDYALLKTKPAARWLLYAYAPDQRTNETQELFTERRQMASTFIEQISWKKVISHYKGVSTQDEKIDIAFRYLYEAQEIIKAQKEFEEGISVIDLPLFGEFGFEARSLGYFK